jgi:transposase
MAEISDRLGYCRQSISEWIQRYNAGGINALFDRPRPGQPKHLTTANEMLFKKRILDGPKESDGVATFTGKFLIKILKDEFNVKYGLSGVYKLLERLKLSSLLPRPKHEKNDLNAMKKWEEELPSVVEDIKKKSWKRNSYRISGRNKIWTEDSKNTSMG